MATGLVAQPFDCFSTLVDRHNPPAAVFSEQDEYKRVQVATRFSNSQSLSDKSWRRMSHTKNSLKNHVRRGVKPGVRRDLWRESLEIYDEDVVQYSKAMGEPQDDGQFVLPSAHFPDIDGLPCFSLQNKIFKTAYTRVLHYIRSSNPHVSYSPVMVGMAHVLLHFMEEWECYIGLTTLIQRQAWLDKTQQESQSSVITLCRLAATHLHTVNFSHNKPIGMGEDVFLSKLMTNWHLWPFTNQPFWFLVRIMDLYLVEGPKVMYRLALAAIKLMISSNFISPDDPSVWVTQYLSKLSIEQRGHWVATGLAIPRLSWNNILKLWLQHSSVLPELPPPALHPPNDQTSAKRSVQPCPSEILTPLQWRTLWNWLPDWVTSDKPEQLFQASRDGYNLRTLYRQCEMFDPLLLVVKTTEDAVLGALTVGSLTERHDTQFFGSGESFIFSLLPTSECFHWSAESDLILRANDEELIVGSGGGAYGLWLDGELDRGSTATCTAFNNTPLTGSGVVDFKCAAVEVFYCPSS